MKTFSVHFRQILKIGKFLISGNFELDLYGKVQFIQTNLYCQISEH